MAVLDGWVWEEVTMLWTCRRGGRCRSDRVCLLELWSRTSRALSDLSLSLSLLSVAALPASEERGCNFARIAVIMDACVCVCVCVCVCECVCVRAVS